MNAPLAVSLADPPEHPLDEALVDWMLGQAAEPATVDEDEPVAAHLFACGRCCRQVEALGVVVGALGQLQRHGHQPIQSRASLAALERRGERLQHIQGSDRGEVRCAISREADIIVLHLPVPEIAGAPLTVTLCAPDGHPFLVLDAPDAEGGEVLLACHRSVADGNPALRVQVKRAGGGREIVCDALFVQSPPP